MTAKRWEAKNPETAFFPIELRPIFMKTGEQVAKDGQQNLFESESFMKLPRHHAVVDVDKDIAFAEVTDDCLRYSLPKIDMKIQHLHRVRHV